VFGVWRQEGYARQSMLERRLVALRQRQARAQSVMCSCGLRFVCCIVGLRPRDALVMRGKVHGWW